MLLPQLCSCPWWVATRTATFWLDAGVTEWASLRDGYGSAEHLPTLLAAAADSGSEEGGVWDELWGRLCHQGTVYSASYAALPALARISRQHAPGGYIAALHLAAAIIAATDGPEEPASVRRRYEKELAEMHDVATVCLQHANDDTEFVYGLQTLMAFEEGGVWQRRLSGLTDGQVELDCPTCDEHLLIAINGPKATVESFGDGSLAAAAMTPVEPAPATVEGRLLALARGHNRPGVAEEMPYLFGTATCPRCQTPFELPQSLT